MASLYKAVFIDPWPWWAGGIAIGLLVPALYLVSNTALGASTGYGTVLRLIPGIRSLKWIQKNFSDKYGWRLFLLAGMVIGGFLAARLTRAPIVTFQMGYLTLPNAGLGPSAIGLILFVGGFLLALGARIAGGCTSGHSIHGIANLHLSSLITSAAFFLAGIIMTHLFVVPLLGGMR